MTSGIELHNPTANPNAPIFYSADATQGAGTLAILDFSRSDCWSGDVSSAPVNLASDTATTLTGNACNPTFAGKTANISLINSMLSIGIEKARMELPPALTTYCIGRQIAFIAYVRTCQGTVTQWTAGAAVAVGDQIYNGNLIWTATVAGVLGTAAPTHTSGAAANGTATLTAGVQTSASAYGLLNPGGFFGLDTRLTSAAAHDYDIFGNSGASFTDFYTGAINQAKLNAVAAAPGYAGANGSVGSTGAQIPAASVITASTTLNSTTISNLSAAVAVGQSVVGAGIPAGATVITAGAAGGSAVLAAGYAATATAAGVSLTVTSPIGFEIENFSAGTGYDATAGTVAQNLYGPRLQLARLEIHDLSVNGLTAAQQFAKSRAFMAAYHPLASLLA